jgi:Uma2 family endonuclease
MDTEVIKRRFTVDEYHRMDETGIFGPEDRLELIDGEILEMSPIGQRHASRVARATALFVRTLGDRAVVNPQNPLQLSDWTEPQPDIVILKPRPDFYEHLRPTPGDALLVMEVSDTTLRFDLKIKLKYFAAASIPEVWIQDVKRGFAPCVSETRRGQICGLHTVEPRQCRISACISGSTIYNGRSVRPSMTGVAAV